MTIIENKCEVYLLFSTVLGSRQLHCRAGLQSKVSIRVMRGKMGHFETFPRLARLVQAATGFSCNKYNITLGNYTEAGRYEKYLTFDITHSPRFLNIF